MTGYCWRPLSTRSNTLLFHKLQNWIIAVLLINHTLYFLLIRKRRHLLKLPLFLFYVYYRFSDIWQQADSSGQTWTHSWISMDFQMCLCFWTFKCACACGLATDHATGICLQQVFVFEQLWNWPEGKGVDEWRIQHLIELSWIGCLTLQLTIFQ